MRNIGDVCVGASSIDAGFQCSSRRQIDGVQTHDLTTTTTTMMMLTRCVAQQEIVRLLC